jgi:hypothetical protein
VLRRAGGSGGEPPGSFARTGAPGTGRSPLGSRLRVVVWSKSGALRARRCRQEGLTSPEIVPSVSVSRTRGSRERLDQGQSPR